MEGKRYLQREPINSGLCRKSGLLSRWYILSTTWYSTPYLKGMVVEVAGSKWKRERERLLLSRLGVHLYILVN